MIIPEKVWDLPDSQLQKQKSRWVILPPGKENALSNTLLTKMCLHDYENLCTLDCLGIEEKHENNNKFVYVEFRKKLGRDSVGNSETHLIWKECHPLLRRNEVNNIGKLHFDQTSLGSITRLSKNK